MPSSPRHGDAGVTLVEVLVALAIFALIGAAGFGMLDQVARVERLSEARLQRLESMQRMMRVITVDFAHARAEEVTGQGDRVRLGRSAEAGAVALDYRVEGGQLRRSLVGQGGAVRAEQVLLADVAGAEWMFLDQAGVWQPEWPPVGGPSSGSATVGGEPPHPRAVALTLRLGDGSSLRRVAAMPGAIR